MYDQAVIFFAGVVLTILVWRRTCLFRLCDWVWIADAKPCGIYQCRRCKTISVGAARPGWERNQYPKQADQNDFGAELRQLTQLKE